MRRSRILVGAAIAAALATSVPGAAQAKQPTTTDPNCFGKGASQIARGEFDTRGISGMGDHASSQDTPRVGIGNVYIGGTDADGDPWGHQSDMAAALGADC